MKIPEETQNKIIRLYCTTKKSIFTILHEVSPNGEITFEELRTFLKEYTDKNPDKLRRNTVENSTNIILEVLEKGLTTKEIAEDLEVTPNTIIYRIQKMKERGIIIPEIGKAPRCRKSRNSELDNKILELLSEGLNQKETAERLGVSLSTIKYRIRNMKKRGVTIPKIKTKSDELNNKILKLLSEGLNKEAIAERLGVSIRAISRRITNMNTQWKIIPEITINGENYNGNKNKQISELSIKN